MGFNDAWDAIKAVLEDPAGANLTEVNKKDPDLQSVGRLGHEGGYALMVKKGPIPLRHVEPTVRHWTVWAEVHIGKRAANSDRNEAYKALAPLFQTLTTALPLLRTGSVNALFVEGDPLVVRLNNDRYAGIIPIRFIYTGA